MRGSSVAVAAAIMAAALFVDSPPGHGTSYSPFTPEDCPATAVLAPSATVFLFHSGTEQTRQAIREGDVLAVVRSLTNDRDEAVGTIRVDEAVGGLCFRGIVLAGELRPLDVAAADPVSYLVLPTDAPCLHGAKR